MDVLKEKIVGLLRAGGGSVPYPDVLAAMGSFERQSLIRTLDVMKGEGTITQTVTFDAATSSILHAVNLSGD